MLISTRICILIDWWKLLLQMVLFTCDIIDLLWLNYYNKLLENVLLDMNERFVFSTGCNLGRLKSAFNTFCAETPTKRRMGSTWTCATSLKRKCRNYQLLDRSQRTRKTNCSSIHIASWIRLLYLDCLKNNILYWKFF